MPQRIQLSRAKGWRKPSNAVVVARPSRWGNPFVVEATPRRLGLPIAYAVLDKGPPPDRAPLLVTHDRREAHQLAVDEFDIHTGPFGLYEPDNPGEWLAPLRGRDLACWCPPDLPCHADSLIRWCGEVFGVSGDSRVMG